MDDKLLNMLRLMQFADSALPIGTLAHSYGLETLVEEGSLTVSRLYPFLQDYLAETGSFEAAFCLGAYHASLEEWLRLNSQLDALKVARESREASTALGRRFLQLVIKLEPTHIAEQALQLAKTRSIGTHYCMAFGLACAHWQIEPELVVVSFLQQSIVSLVSACQRLMPLGQTNASRLIWELKPAILETAQHGTANELPFMFAVAVEVGSMRHPDLMTRLFIS